MTMRDGRDTDQGADLFAVDVDEISRSADRLRGVSKRLIDESQKLRERSEALRAEMMRG